MNRTPWPTILWWAAVVLVTSALIFSIVGCNNDQTDAPVSTQRKLLTKV